MGKSNIFLALFLGVVLVVVSLFIFINFNTLEKKEYVVKFEIGGTYGFDLNSSALTFGRIPAGSSATRSVFIENNFDKNIFVSISSSKEISHLLSISENDFFLKPGENKTISFFVYSYPNTSVGKYEGRVNLVVSRYGSVFNDKY